MFSESPHVFSEFPHVFSESPHVFSEPLHVFSESLKILKGIFEASPMRSYLVAVVLVASIYAETPNEKLKRCCKAYEGKDDIECLTKHCSFDAIAQTNVSSARIIQKQF